MALHTCNVSHKPAAELCPPIHYDNSLHVAPCLTSHCASDALIYMMILAADHQHILRLFAQPTTAGCANWPIY